MTAARLRTVFAVAIATFALYPTAAHALPTLPEQPPPAIVVTSTASTQSIPEALLTSSADAPSADKAVAEAISLEERIARDRADATALEQRVEITNLRLFRQQDVLSRTQITLTQARSRYSVRVAEIYKGGALDPLLMLLSSRTLTEFTARFQLFAAVLKQDRGKLQVARIAAEQAAYEQNRLEELKAQLVIMRSLKAQRLEDMGVALSREKRIASTLTRAQARVVARKRDERELTFREWRKTTIPVGTPIDLLAAAVAPWSDPYLIAEYQPRSYRVVSQKYVAVCSWYGDEFNGKGTASGQIFNEDDLVCASRTLPFGTRLALERDGKRIVVMVTDRGPFIPGRDLDLSKRAAHALGFDGVEPVVAEFVEVVK